MAIRGMILELPVSSFSTILHIVRPLMYSMSYDLASNDMRRIYRRHTNSAPHRGMTLLEILVALAVALAFLSGVIAAFIQILRVSDRSQAQVEAANNARAALEIIANDIKLASIDSRQKEQVFRGSFAPLTYGDGIDNDGDGVIDEEYFDADDNDIDWTILDDNHTNIEMILFERPLYVAAPDPGDFHVNEDCVFNTDRLRFWIFPGLLTERNEIITYEIGSYEGEQNVLLRTVAYYQDRLFLEEITSPLAFNVLSLNFLYWDPNRPRPVWVVDWNGQEAATFPLPGIEIPVAVYVNITVYSGSLPIEQVQPFNPIETVSLSTIVCIEQVLRDTRYRDFTPLTATEDEISDKEE